MSVSYPPKHHRPDESVDLDQHIPAQLFALSALVSQHAQRMSARPLGLDMCEWRVIQILGRDGASSINQIADRIAMDRGGTSRAIARLEKRGFLNRIAQLDRRRSCVDLTDSGRELNGRIARFANARELRLLHGLSAAEQRTLAELLAKLESEARTMLEENWQPVFRDDTVHED